MKIRTSAYALGRIVGSHAVGFGQDQMAGRGADRGAAVLRPRGHTVRRAAPGRGAARRLRLRADHHSRGGPVVPHGPSAVDVRADGGVGRRVPGAELPVRADPAQRRGGDVRGRAIHVVAHGVRLRRALHAGGVTGFPRGRGDRLDHLVGGLDLPAHGGGCADRHPEPVRCGRSRARGRVRTAAAGTGGPRRRRPRPVGDRDAGRRGVVRAGQGSGEGTRLTGGDPGHAQGSAGRAAVRTGHSARVGAAAPVRSRSRTCPLWRHACARRGWRCRSR